MRKALATTTVALWLLLVLVWSMNFAPGDPWHARTIHTLPGNELASVAGDGVPVQGGLKVSGLGKYGQALQSWRLEKSIDAGQTPILLYRTHGFPRSLELALLYRTQSAPDDVRSLTLPWPRNGVAALDLSTLPHWHGGITELGFSEYPIPGQTPPDIDFAPFVIEGASLQSPSISGLWQVTRTRWLAWNPWSMRSINANRAASAYAYGIRGSLVLMLALMLAGGVIILFAFGQMEGRARQVTLGIVLLAWLLLDVRWLSQMQRNHALAHTLFQDKAWSDRSRIIADRPLQQRAELVNKVLAQQQPGVHVLYWTPSQVDSVRLGYFLRPNNVAALPPGMDADDVPDGTLLLIDDQDTSWQWDSFHSRLSRSGYVIHGDLLWRQGDMLLLTVRREAGS